MEALSGCENNENNKFRDKSDKTYAGYPNF